MSFEPMTGHRLEIGRAIPRSRMRPKGGIDQRPWLPLGTPYRIELPFSVTYYRDARGRIELVTYPFCIDLSWPWWRPWKEQ